MAYLHSTDDATPSVHNSFSQRDDIIIELVGAVRSSSDGRGLLQDLSNDGQISLEVATNSIGYVTKALKDGRLKLVRKRLAL